MSLVRFDASPERPASRWVPVEVALETAMARLCGRRPAVIVSAHIEDLTATGNHHRLKLLARSALCAGFAVLYLCGSWHDGNRSWTQWFLAVFGSREREPALRAWVLQARFEFGQEVALFKSSRSTTDLLFDSGRTERWPAFSLELVTKAYQRSRGRGALMLERALVLRSAANIVARTQISG